MSDRNITMINQLVAAALDTRKAMNHYNECESHFSGACNCPHELELDLQRGHLRDLIQESASQLPQDLKKRNYIDDYLG